MNIDTHLDVIKACRFCFMCRHLATTANVTFREADIPRGIALLLDRVRMNPAALKNADFIRTLYDSTLSAACRKHCVSHFDEAGLVLAARRDVVEQDLAPAEVRRVADELTAGFAPTVSGKTGNVLYVRITTDEEEDAPVASAFEAIMEKVGAGAAKVLRANDSGKAMAVLGFTEQAKKMAARLAELIEQSGCDTVVTSCPATYDALKNDYPAWGVKWPEGVSIHHTSTWLAELLQDETLKADDTTDSRPCYYLDSDYLRNYNDISTTPRDILRTFGYDPKPFGTNDEESFALGEGAVVFDRIRPDLVLLLRKRLEMHMDSPEDLIITASPYTRRILAETSTGLTIAVSSLEEAIADKLSAWNSPHPCVSTQR